MNKTEAQTLKDRGFTDSQLLDLGCSEAIINSLKGKPDTTWLEDKFAAAFNK